MILRHQTHQIPVQTAISFTHPFYSLQYPSIEPTDTHLPLPCKSSPPNQQSTSTMSFCLVPRWSGELLQWCIQFKAVSPNQPVAAEFDSVQLLVITMDEDVFTSTDRCWFILLGELTMYQVIFTLGCSSSTFIHSTGNEGLKQVVIQRHYHRSTNLSITLNSCPKRTTISIVTRFLMTKQSLPLRTASCVGRVVTLLV
jgi:hypothetical protein